MTDPEILLRYGFYAGLIESELGDVSYVQGWRSRPAELSLDDLLALTREIHDKLATAGVIQPDEDPFEEFVLSRRIEVQV